MKYSKDQMSRLKYALTSAHQSKTAEALPEDSWWRKNVMQSVRRIGPIQKDAYFHFGFSQLAWRLAPAAIALMMLMTVLILKVDDSVEYQLAGLMVSDPVQTYVTFEPLNTEQ
jgi:hypothetical protein